MFSTVLAAMAFRQIEKVAEAELSVTWTDKLTGPDDELSTWICFIRHLAPEGDFKTLVVSVLVKFIP